MRSERVAVLGWLRWLEEGPDGTGLYGSAPDELAVMVLELAALIVDAAPHEEFRASALGEVYLLPGPFEPLWWSAPPELSAVCEAVCAELPVAYEGGPDAYAIQLPWERRDPVIAELLFALRVLRRLAWLRTEEGEGFDV